ncbi:putative 2-oxoglutarate/Fe(II)-dependent dioxygenase [Morus notabilis]|uniref:Putative 2-oxoglutarate/Fe(II)-dependent dioxygenase n=1 Tax=Morus notabilis TaxID=981085 RepID=W9R1G5_9ROSA|nr:protein DMR6-LIKE OXYGENASE 2 [Morus notabilis]EXB63676.1 putative 2-oxoglutarate/Fe(II)-dependent dioxygenase [Morus notabilis]
MGEVDPAFIQDAEHRPKLSNTKPGDGVEGVPLIDLSQIRASDADDHDPRKNEDLVREIGSACEEWGFFQVINHGVATETRRSIESAARAFFGQALEEKRKVRRDEKSLLGYYDTELTKNVRDWKDVFDMAAVEPIIVPSTPDPDDHDLLEWFNQWPDYPPEFREACEEYARETGKLAMKLMELIARSLGLPANKFKDYFKDQTSFMRLNHYPPCPFPHLALGVGRHKDFGCLTVLAQDDVGGLEVRRKSDGEWISLKPTPDAYIINVGDIIQVWSNDRYESVEHRVRERFSIPFFLNPAHYTVVKPLEELIDEDNPPKFRAYSWGKFLIHRSHSNFKKQNVENIQTYHFRLQ